ncbi:MAG: signal peptidase I [Actinobacteria bacterium]|nr:MAG: signal peptidase I [Actinomycetota bacterium]
MTDVTPAPEDPPSGPAAPAPGEHGAGWTVPRWAAADPGTGPPTPAQGVPPVAPGPEPGPEPATGSLARPEWSPPVPVAEKERARHGGAVRSVLEWVAIVAAALIAALVIKAFVIQAFYIPSGSMEPTLKVGDRVLVNKLAYHAHPVHRGDVVVFTRPKLEGGAPAIKDLIKRVIGLPGDTIQSVDGQVVINDRTLREPYLPAGTTTTGIDRQVIPPGQYWVMGDNRSNSRDSRFFHAIPKSLIVGRAFVLVWPLSSLQFL